MTTVDILSALRAINRENMPYMAKLDLDRLTAQVEEKARAEAATGMGRGAAAASIVRMIRGLEKRPSLYGSWTDAAGRQCVCDGFRAYRLYKALPLPVLDPAEKPLNLDNVFTPDVTQGKELPTPDPKHLKAFITLQRAANGRKGKATTPPVWSFGDGLPAVNAQWLLELLTVLPGAKLYYASTSRMGPVYAASEAGDGLLLPVRLAAETTAGKLLQTASDRSEDAVPTFHLREFAAYAKAIRC